MTQDNSKFYTSSLNHFSDLQKSQQNWINSLREQGIESFKTTNVPTTKNEDWKYVNLKPLVEQDFSLSSSQNKTLPQDLIDFCKLGKSYLIFVNGVLQKDLSVLPNQQSLLITELNQIDDAKAKTLKDIFFRENIKQHSFINLNTAFLDNGVFIEVLKNQKIEDLIHIVHVSSEENSTTMSHPRNFIHIQQGAQAQILESFVSLNNFQNMSHLTNSVTHIHLDANAVLDYTKYQNEDHTVFHIGHTLVSQKQDSQFYSFSFSLGAKIARHNLDISLNETGSFASLNGLYAVKDSQLVDNHTSVNHLKPNCTSHQLYKGILDDSSRGVFNGKIFVRQDAQQTSSEQLNKNILLGPKARIDTKPQLEIDADDVKCQHGATVGQLDSEELFYFQSRGIKKDTALQMMTEGFASDVLDTIRNQSLKNFLNQKLKDVFFKS